MAIKQILIIFLLVMQLTMGQRTDHDSKSINSDWKEHTFDFKSDQQPDLIKEAFEDDETAALPCKYLIVEQTLLAKWQLDVNSIEFTKLLYSPHQPGSLELNANLVKIRSIDNCLDRAIIDQMETQIRANKSILYGLDFSSSGMDESGLQALVRHYASRANHVSIRHLNLSSCQFKSLEVLANLTDYFPNLEAIIFDHNRMTTGRSAPFKKQNRLKIISLNKCNLNEQLPNAEESVKEYPDHRASAESINTSLIYLGLSGNKLSSLANVYKIFDGLGYIQPSSIQVLDFSYNLLSNLDDLKHVLGDFEPKQVILERNLIGAFDVNDLNGSTKPQRYVELNLKQNFINNMSASYFKYKNAQKTTINQTRVSISLHANPLICDCETMWLFEEYNEFKKRVQTAPKLVNLNRTNRTAVENGSAEPRVVSLASTALKRRKVKAKSKTPEPYPNRQNSGIRLIYKRAMEEISSHHNLDDPGMGHYMQRQKRVKQNRQSLKAALKLKLSFSDIDEQLAENQLVAGSKSVVNIVDLSQLTCKFIDVQNFPSNDQLYQSFSAASNKSSEMTTTTKSPNDDYVFYEENIITDLSSLDSDIKQQNMAVESVKYREKPISASSPTDYMCSYEDQCDPSECNCCDFRHCHCRSICPRQCKCYFDHKLKKNVVDCSNLNLVDVSIEPIEMATDLRLNSNNLGMLKSHTFFGFGQLKYLYLQNNHISYLTSDAFEDLKHSLKILNLASNRLNYLKGDEFSGLKELVILILNKNPLRDIEDVTFISRKSLPSLRFLSMTDTNLKGKKLNDLVGVAKAQQLPNLNIKYLAKVNDKKNLSSETTAKPLNKTGQQPKNLSATTKTPTKLAKTTPKRLTNAETKSTRKQADKILNDLSVQSVIESKTNPKDESGELELGNEMMNREVHESTMIYNLFGLLSNSTDQETNSSSSSNTSLSNLKAKFFLYQYKLMNWYYFPLAVFAACLVLSFFIILAVVLVAKKYETGQPMSVTEAKKSLQSKTTKLSGTKRRGLCCFGRSSESSLSSSLNYSSNFVTIHSNDIDDIAADVEEDDDEDDDASTVDDSTPRCGFIRLAFKSSKTRKKKLSNAMCPYKNKTNYECYNNLTTTTHHLNETKVHHRHLVDSVDFATSVPVSRSIHNLVLNVYIYYNVADEDYVSSYLMPFLEQKCLTIIPETNYIKRPQAVKFVSFSPTEAYTSRSVSRSAKHAQMILSTPTTSTEENGTAENGTKNNNSSYHKKSTSSTTSTTTGSSSSSSSDCHEESTSLTSSGTSTQTQTRNPAKSRAPNRGTANMLSLRQSRCESNSLVANILVVSDNFYGFKTLSCNNDSLSSCRSKSSNQKSKYFKSSSNDNLFKNSFKIYLLNTTCQTLALQSTGTSSAAATTTASTTSTDLTDDNKSHSNDFSSKSGTLARRIYETTTPANGGQMMTKSQLTITNDMYSSFAYNEKLQFKLERYFENICLKSSTLSNTNFSYVDYSSKR